MDDRFVMVLVNNQLTWIKELPNVSKLKEYILNEFKKSIVLIYINYGLTPDGYLINEWSDVSIETEIEHLNNTFVPFKCTKTATFYRCSVCESRLKRIDDDYIILKGHNSSCRKRKTNICETSLSISNFNESQIIKKLSFDSSLDEISVESKSETKEVDLTCAK